MNRVGVHCYVVHSAVNFPLTRAGKVLSWPKIETFAMGNPFFDHPILNSPYQKPSQYWELDEDGQPTQQIIQTRRTAQFITPIPKPRKRKGKAAQQELPLDEVPGLSTENQQYATTSTINKLRFLQIPQNHPEGRGQ